MIIHYTVYTVRSAINSRGENNYDPPSPLPSRIIRLNPQRWKLLKNRIKFNLLDTFRFKSKN